MTSSSHPMDLELPWNPKSYKLNAQNKSTHEFCRDRALRNAWIRKRQGKILNLELATEQQQEAFSAPLQRRSSFSFPRACSPGRARIPSMDHGSMATPLPFLFYICSQPWRARIERAIAHKTARNDQIDEFWRRPNFHVPGVTSRWNRPQSQKLWDRKSVV